MREVLSVQQEIEIMKELEQYDTPTITNVVATYPGKSTCLSLFEPWNTDWYTDETCKAMFPELGRRCGFAVTCVYGIPDPNFKGGPGISDVLGAVGRSPKPAVLVLKQDVPEKYRKKFGLLGANMATAFKSAGCNAIITDGPSRDLDDVRKLEIQYMITGASAGHGPMGVMAVNIPVTVCSMAVTPGDIVHMDVNGAVRFPREYLADVLSKCKELSEIECKKIEMLGSTSDVELLSKYMLGVYD